MIVKLGRTWIGILFFCIYFLVVELFTEIGTLIRKYKIKIVDSKYYSDEQKKEDEEAIDEINSYVDSLLPKDKELLIRCFCQ